MLWSNVLGSARWKQRCFTKEEWRTIHEFQHWLFQAFPFLTQHNIEPDELHILYLGTVQHICGSILKLMVYKLLPGTPEENIHRVFACICTCYTQARTCNQYTNLDLSSFCDFDKPNASYPMLRGKGPRPGI